MVIWRPNEKIPDQEIDKNNMDNIDIYIKAKKEFDKNGYWVGFMGVTYTTEPPPPRLCSYSWE